MKSILMLCVLALGSSAAHAAVLITFDEVATQAADGLTVDGVTFGFTVGGTASSDATFNSELPVTTTYLDNRVLAGPVMGLLTIQFSIPTTAFQFGLVLNTLDAESPAATVSLYDSALLPLGDVPLDTNPLILFSEGLFSYSGAAVAEVRIAFSGTTAADLFAIDNLQYEGDLGIPEAGSVAMVSLGLAGLGILRMIPSLRR